MKNQIKHYAGGREGDKIYAPNGKYAITGQLYEDWRQQNLASRAAIEAAAKQPVLRPETRSRSELQRLHTQAAADRQRIREEQLKQKNEEAFWNLVSLTSPSTYVGQAMGQPITGAAALATDALTLGAAGALKSGVKSVINTAGRVGSAVKETINSAVNKLPWTYRIPENPNMAYRRMSPLERDWLMGGNELSTRSTNVLTETEREAAVAAEKAVNPNRRFVLFKAGAEHGGRKQFAKGQPWKGTTVTHGEEQVLAIPGEGLPWVSGRHYKGPQGTGFRVGDVPFEEAPFGSHIDLLTEEGYTGVNPSLLDGSVIYSPFKIFGHNFGYKKLYPANTSTPIGLRSDKPLIARGIDTRTSDISGIEYGIFDKILGKPRRDIETFSRYVKNSKEATAESVESAFNIRRKNYKGDWDTGEYREPIAATKSTNKQFADERILALRAKYPNASEDLLHGALFTKEYGVSYDDLLNAAGFIYRGERNHVTGYDVLKHALYTKKNDPVISSLNKTHEANHTAFNYTSDRYDKHTMNVLDTPEGTKVYFNENAGVKLPKLNSSNPDEFYLDVDETTTYLSEAANFLGKTTPWTPQELQWLSKNLSILDRMRHYNIYHTIFNRITDYKKFARALGKGLMYSSASIPLLANPKLYGYTNE